MTEKDGEYRIFKLHIGTEPLWCAEWRPYKEHGLDIWFIVSGPTASEAFKSIQREVTRWTGERQIIGFWEYVGLLTR